MRELSSSAKGFLLSETHSMEDYYMSSTPPTAVIRDTNIKATIWENQGEKGTYFTTTLAKTYRDQNGELRDTNVFTNNDLLKVSELAKEARTKTRELQQGRSQEQMPDTGRTHQADDRKTRNHEQGFSLDR